jgi:hypothetical protein
VSRWKLKQDTVTVGENSVVVRQLTAGERRQFVELGKKTEVPPMERLAKLVEWCALPQLTKEELDQMPPELQDAAVSKVMELSGLGKPEAGEEGGEKKADPTVN